MISFQQVYDEAQESISENDLLNEIQLNEGIVSSAAAVGLYFRNTGRLKDLDFSKPKNIGKDSQYLLS